MPGFVRIHRRMAVIEVSEEEAWNVEREREKVRKAKESEEAPLAPHRDQDTRSHLQGPF